MNYYQEPTSYYHGNYGIQDEINQASMLGNISEPNRSQENNLDYDPDYDKEVKELLEECEADYCLGNSTINNGKEDEVLKVKQEQYEDYYNEFAPDEPVDEVPKWYSTILKTKQQNMIRRIDDFTKMITYTSPKAWNHVKLLEQDHHTPLCKINFPRHPPLTKPWQNYWRFNCVIKCNVLNPEPSHAHTVGCEEILLEHVSTGVSTKSSNIFPMEFPEYVMRTVEVFQNFVNKTSNDDSYFDKYVVADTTYEKPTWCYIKIRSNYKNEIMLIVCGKGVTPILGSLKHYFKNGPGRTCNVVSLYCTNIKWSQKKSQFPPTFMSGQLELRDKVGPISINYNPKTSISFNAIEAEQLGKIMMEYLAPTTETTVLDIGCNFGALSLMLSYKSNKVIGLNTLDHEIKLADHVKDFNKIHNVTFLTCTPKEVQTKCSSLIKQCITVAMFNLSTPYGKSSEVMKALRNLPSIWRVALYGSFTKEYHKNLTLLMAYDSDLGDEFLPMQGCILDKSPSVPNDYSVIIVFERKSLIEPKVDLIGCGPTVNIKDDFDKKVVPTKIPVVKRSELVTRCYGKHGKYDSPTLPKEKNVKPVIVSSSKDEPTNLLPPDYGQEEKSIKSTIDLRQICDMTTPSPSTYKALKKIYDSPLLPKKNNAPLSKSNDTTALPTSNAVEIPTYKDLKKKYDSPLLSKSSKNSSLSNSIKTEPNSLLNISTDPRCDFLSERDEDSRSNFLSKIKTESRSNFESEAESKPFIDTRFDFLNKVNEEKPFDKSFVPKKERGYLGPVMPKKDKRFDCPSLHIKKEKQYNSSLQNSEPRSSVDIKEEPQFNIQTVPVSVRKSFNSPPAQEVVSSISIAKAETFINPPLPISLPPDYNVHPPNYIAPPPDFSIPPPNYYLPPLPPKEERLPSFEEKEDGELSCDSIDSLPEHLPDANIKVEPMDLDDDPEESLGEMPSAKAVNFVKLEEATTKEEPTETLPVIRIKSEPIDSSEISESTNEFSNTMEFPVRVKTEPIDNEMATMTPPRVIKPEKNMSDMDLDTFTSMATPVHRPAALEKDNQASSSPPPASANFKTIDGFEFSVQPNQSYLAGTIKIKKEPGLQDVQIKEEESKQEPFQPESIIVKQEENIVSVSNKPSAIRVKKLDTILDINKKGNDEDDINVVGEIKPNKISKEKSYNEKEIKNTKTEIDSELRKLMDEKKKLQEQLRLSESSYNSSPPLNNRRRYGSPSPPWDNKRSRSRSPPYRRYKYSSPSPMTERHYRRSPSPKYRRKRRSPSPLSNRTFKRSPSSYSDRRYKHSSSPLSDRRIRRSPSSYSDRWFKRSPTSSGHKTRSPSPRRHSTHSPMNRKHSSLSSRSPSPPQRRYSQSTFSDNVNNVHKVKRKSSSSENLIEKKKKKEKKNKTKIKNKDDDLWDIPVLSSLQNSENIKKPKMEKDASPDSSTLFIPSSISTTITKDEITS